MVMERWHLCILISFVSVLLIPFQSCALDVQCPETLKVEEKAASVAQGWQAGGMHTRDHMLENIRIGRLGFIGSFREDDEVRAQGVIKDTWQLSDSKITYSINCIYSNTDIILTQPVAKNIRSCESLYAIRNKAPYPLIRTHCYE